MKPLDHSSLDALLADLRRNRDGWFCSESRTGRAGRPWRAVHAAILGAAPSGRLQLHIRLADGAERSRTFRLRDGWLFFPGRGELRVALPDGGPPPSAVQRIDDNLRSVFA